VREGFIRYGLSAADIKKKIHEFKPDVVGVGGMHSNRVYEVQDVLEAVKAVSGGIITVVGGGYASMHPEHCLSSPNCDYVVLGEGEYTARDLLRRIDQKKDISDLDGFGYKIKGKFRINPKTVNIPNLDEIPFPAYHLLKMKDYFNIRMPGSRYEMRNYSLFCGSRGCPHKCSYCAKALIVGEGYRKRSISNMIEEITLLKNDFKVEEIRFVDYHTMADVKHWKAFCRALVDQKIGIRFIDPHGFAVNALNGELIELMHEAGCDHLYISIESGDQEFLSRLSKRVDLGKVEGIIRKSHELDMPVTGYFIIGLPGQTWKEIAATVEYAKSLDLDDVDFFIANPFPGTDIYGECEEKRLMYPDFDFQRIRYSLNNIKGPDYTREMIESVRRDAWFEIMTRNMRKGKIRIRR
ncbi:MAG: hypothetical protein A2Z72_08420, partial [Omnitrophica bacterium RBG_13_46_9]